MATYPDFTNARRYGGQGIRDQLRDSGNSVSGLPFANAQQLGYLPYNQLEGINDFRFQKPAGPTPNDGTMSVGVYNTQGGGGDATTNIDPEALAAFLDSKGYKIGEWEGGEGQWWRWIEDANGNYVVEPRNYHTNDRTAAMIGMMAIGGMMGAGALGALGQAGAGAAGAGTASLGGALPTFGAGLGEGLIGGVDLLGSSLLTGSSGIGGAAAAAGAGAGAAGAGTSALGGGALPTFGMGEGLVGGTDIVGSSLLTGGAGAGAGGGGAAAAVGALKGGGGLVEQGLGWLAEQAGFPEGGKWLEGSGLGRDLLGLFGSGMQQWNIEKVAQDQRDWIDSKEAAGRQRRTPVRGTAGALRVVGG